MANTDLMTDNEIENERFIPEYLVASEADYGQEFAEAGEWIAASEAACFKCRQPADHMQQVSQEAAMVHDMLYGGGVYIAPGEGYVLPVCHDRDHEYRLCAHEDHARTCFCCDECGGHEAQHIRHAYETGWRGCCYTCDLDAEHPIHISAGGSTDGAGTPCAHDVLPVCHDCNPWGASNGHTWTYDGVCLTCGAPEADDPAPCPVDE